MKKRMMKRLTIRSAWTDNFFFVESFLPVKFFLFNWFTKSFSFGIYSCDYLLLSYLDIFSKVQHLFLGHFVVSVYGYVL